MVWDRRKFVGVDGPRRHRLCRNEVVVDLRQRRPSVEQISRIGMDSSKHVFQLDGVNAAEVVVLRKKLAAQGDGGILREADADSNCDRSLRYQLEVG
jgi:hypothetical protein